MWVLQMLEWYGFCGLGEAGPFLAEGHTRPGGKLPVNTYGGQLSESYTHNWMHLYEAVTRTGCRAICDGARTSRRICCLAACLTVC